MTQAIFVAFFEDEGRSLRAWDPGRGRSLKSFVALLARHQTLSLLRYGKTSEWREHSTDGRSLEDLASSTAVPEEIVGSREHLHHLLDNIRLELPISEQELFQCLVIDAEPAAEVARKFGKSLAALYQWKSRLLARLRQLSAEMCAVPESLGERSGNLPPPKGRSAR